MRWDSEAHKAKFYDAPPIERITVAMLMARQQTPYLLQAVQVLATRGALTDLGDLYQLEAQVYGLASASAGWAGLALDEFEAVREGAKDEVREEIRRDEVDYWTAIGKEQGW